MQSVQILKECNDVFLIFPMGILLSKKQELLSFDFLEIHEVLLTFLKKNIVTGYFCYKFSS